MHAPAWTGHVVADRYRLGDPIGHGAMGTVWRARDELLDRDVAVKEVRIPAVLSPAGRSAVYQRTLREAKTAARLNHSGVVTVFDVVEEDGRPWIIMELVRAPSLDRVLAEDGPLHPARAAAIGHQLVSALATAHAAGVLHRDVKPSNVLLCPDGRAVLTDFGIATLEGDTRLTQTGMVMGTPAFTPPERLRGGPATPASDLWSLGATLYAAVQGRGPYHERGGAITTMNAVIHEDAPAAPSAGPLGPVIAALMRRDPAARPDAAAAAALLSEALGCGPAGQPSGADVMEAASWHQPGPERGPWPADPAAPAGMPWPDGSPGPGPAGVPWPRDGSPGPAGTEGAVGQPAAHFLGPGGTFHGTAAAATVAHVPLTGAGPAPGGAHSAAGRSRRRGRIAVAACAVVIVAAGIIGGFTVARVMRPSASAGDRAGQGASRPGSRASAAPSTGSTPAALPAGYEWYALPAADAGTAAGFRMAAPAGWSVRRSGLVTYLRDPSAPGFMEIDLTPHTFAGEMSEARWLQAQTLRQGKFPGYRRIALRPVAVRGSAGALWMFSWLERGAGRVVAQDYLFDLPAGGGSQSYALYASAPAASWPQTAQALDEAFRTFQPLT